METNTDDVAVKMLGSGYDSMTFLKIASPQDVMTEDFIKTIEFLIIQKTFGIYYFSVDSHPMYIGQSINLGSRLLSSFIERFCIGHNHFIDRKARPSIENIDVSFICPDNKSDLFIIESYLIAKLKPQLNKSGVFEDYPSFDIDIPQFSPTIKCVNSIPDEYKQDAIEKLHSRYDKESLRKYWSMT